MPVIIPVSDSKNVPPEIEEICFKENALVFIKKSGSGHLFVMSKKLFEEQHTLEGLYKKIDEAEEQSERVGKAG